MYRITASEEYLERPIQMEKLCTEIWKKEVYLFVQTQKTQIGNQVYRSEPFIITVPGNYDGQIIWNVTAEPKFKNESIPPITTNTPPVSEEPSGDNSSRTPNVKTGRRYECNYVAFLNGNILNHI